MPRVGRAGVQPHDLEALFVLEDILSVFIYPAF
jgi:hypothetical protein